MIEQFLPLISVAFAMLGALAKYVQSLIEHEDQPFNVKLLFFHLIISIFTSLLVVIVGYNYHWSYLVILAGCGLAGWMGSETIAIVRNILRQSS